MEKVYAIGTGEYSDWHVIGFFTDKLQAEKYCQYMNDRNPYDDYMVEELDNLDKNVDLSGIKPKYTFVFNGKFGDYLGNEQGCLASNDDKPGIRETGLTSTRFMIKVVTTENDRDKAVKIAQDMFAKYKAEKAGL